MSDAPGWYDWLATGLWRVPTVSGAAIRRPIRHSLCPVQHRRAAP